MMEFFSLGTLVLIYVIYVGLKKGEVVLPPLKDYNWKIDEWLTFLSGEANKITRDTSQEERRSLEFSMQSAFYELLVDYLVESNFPRISIHTLKKATHERVYSNEYIRDKYLVGQVINEAFRRAIDRYDLYGAGWKAVHDV